MSFIIRHDIIIKHIFIMVLHGRVIRQDKVMELRILTGVANMGNQSLVIGGMNEVQL